ncbi:MAG: ATP-binding protein [Planctomycetota bacterium]
MVPVVDVFKCNGCGVCVKRCPPKIMGMIQNKAAILVQLCEECGICAEMCPIDAIHFELESYATVGAADAYEKKR